MPTSQPTLGNPRQSKNLGKTRSDQGFSKGSQVQILSARQITPEDR